MYQDFGIHVPTIVELVIPGGNRVLNVVPAELLVVQAVHARIDGVFARVRRPDHAGRGRELPKFAVQRD
jgi:hypothetical protein